VTRGGPPGGELPATASTTALRIDLEAPMAVKSQTWARSTSGGMGRSCARVPRARAHVRQEPERQCRAALMRVARAVLMGAMTVEKAWLMARTVVGVSRAM
jgi:hypothetical protein